MDRLEVANKVRERFSYMMPMVQSQIEEFVNNLVKNLKYNAPVHHYEHESIWISDTQKDIDDFNRTVQILIENNDDETKYILKKLIDNLNGCCRDKLELLVDLLEQK